MNYNGIKRLYEQLPKGIKYLFAPVFIRLMVKNPVYKSMYRKLDAFEKLDTQEQDWEQFRLLKETLIYAYHHVPYYKKKFDEIGFIPETMESFEDIKKIPLLTKEQAIECGTALYSTENIPYYEVYTGGSSGRALKVALDKVSIYKERAVTIHYLHKFGYDPFKTRTLFFLGHNKDRDYYYSPLKNEIVISPFRLFREENFESLWKTVEKFAPRFITGYPSAIYMFVKLMKKYNKRMDFQQVVYYSENCSEDMKAYIENYLGCRIRSTYGHTERAVFAEEYDGGYRFNKCYGYVEFLPTEEENEFQIVCTGFLSRKMPLIRYVTDDVAIFEKNGTVKIKGHRMSEDYLLTKNGRKVFKGALTLHVGVLKKVKQYQYIQYEPGKAYLDVVPLEILTDKDKKEILDYIIRRCEEQLDITLREVKALEMTGRGKYRWAVNKIKQKQEENE